MSAIFLLINHQQQGPFSQEQILDMVQCGTLDGNELAWKEGWTEWKPLSELRFTKAVPLTKPAYTGVPESKRSITSARVLIFAVASLLVAIFGIFKYGFVAGPVAVILGHLARANLKKPKSQYSGAYIASAGLALGYCGIAIMLLTMPKFNKFRQQATLHTCAANLRYIEAAKEFWFIHYGQLNGPDTPSQKDLVFYIKRWPVCPAGGQYSIGSKRENARCSVHSGQKISLVPMTPQEEACQQQLESLRTLKLMCFYDIHADKKYRITKEDLIRYVTKMEPQARASGRYGNSPSPYLEIKEYLNTGPRCPAGGLIDIGTVEGPVTCSIHGAW